MSILINMEMPKDCNKCPLTVEGYCRVIGYPNGDAINKRYKPLWCPLVEVPKHGRLIDADALRAGMYHEAFETDSELQKWDSGCWVRYKMFENHMDNAPTIIEAEE